MSEEPLSGALMQKLGEDLRKLRDLGAIDYYLPSDPEGVRYVVGFQNQILNMNPDEAMYFAAGATAMAYVMARKVGLTL